jgi:predicted nuclease of predicted toxin-antitoxin system
MKLLFDNNLSHKLVLRLADLFPGSTQTRLLNFSTASDLTIWQHAKDFGFLLVTLDKDFSDLALHRGAPPKIIWLRCGNSSVETVERLLRANVKDIHAFELDLSVSVLEIWP